jgi:hypothetical protein
VGCGVGGEEIMKERPELAEGLEAKQLKPQKKGDEVMKEAIKICTKCGKKAYDHDELHMLFTANIACSDGHEGQCKKCKQKEAVERRLAKQNGTWISKRGKKQKTEVGSQKSEVRKGKLKKETVILGRKCRVCGWTEDNEEGQRFSASKVKWLTGGDQLVGRDLYGKKQIRFDPSHTIFLMTNNKPAVAGDDYAFWKRMHLICFQLSYVTKKPEDLEPFERVADPDLEEKL